MTSLRIVMVVSVVLLTFGLYPGLGRGDETEMPAEGAAALEIAAAPDSASVGLNASLPTLSLSAGALSQASPAGPLSALEPSSLFGAAGTPAQRSLGVKAGLGFSLDPNTFLLGFQADFFVHQNVAVGPLLQVGVSGDDFFIAPTLNIEAIFDLPVDGFEAFKPVFQFGLGMVYMDRDTVRGQKDEVGFLLNFGIGVEYFFAEYFAVGTLALFNIMPDEVIDEHFFFTWEVLTFRFQF